MLSEICVNESIQASKVVLAYEAAVAIPLAAAEAAVAIPLAAAEAAVPIGFPTVLCKNSPVFSSGSNVATGNDTPSIAPPRIPRLN